MKKKSLSFWIGLFAIIGGTCVFWISSGFSQAPPNKLTLQEPVRPNPLRADQPIAVPGEIRQTALQGEDIQFPPAANWGNFPTVPAQTATPAQAPSAFEGADPFAAPAQPAAPAFEGIDPFAAPMHDFEMPISFSEPTIPEPVSATQSPAFSTASPTPSTASSLSNADPFAQQQPEAAVPSQALSFELPPDALPALPGRETSVGSFSDFDDQQRTAALMRSSPAQQSPSEGTGTPGTSLLEGPQTPHLTLQKVMPEEVVIDQPATLKTVIQNVGRSVARNVTITDRVPRGTQLLSTIPEADVLPNGELRWSVGNLDPNVQLIVEMKVLPIREGEIGSVASVNYTGEVSGRIAVTRPMLAVEMRAPTEVRLGETANIEIVISNPGTATVTNVVLEKHVPDGLFHRDGRVMQNRSITVLRPRESKKLTLPLLCIGAGNLVNHVVVTADGNLMAEERTTIRALAPVLDLEIVGTRNRFLERRSDYRLIVANKGNASAHNVALELALPRAVQFVSTNQSGVYDSASHTVRWALEELPAQEAGEIELIILPAQKGEHSLRFTGTGENNLRAESVLPISIDGIPAITFDVAGDSNLVEVGKDVVYEIRVVNRGTKAAENVRVRAVLPEGMSFVRAEGGRFQANDGTIQFEPIPLLDARGENVYKLTARGQVEGDHRISIQVISDDLRSSITREESTRVFR